MRKLLLAFLLAVPAWATIGTPILLDLTDRSTVARTGEVVVKGVPVAESYAVTDQANVKITTAPGGACAGGVNIDSHRIVTERWHGDPTDTAKNIKWLLVGISAPTLAGSGTAHVCLADRGVSDPDPGTATTVATSTSTSCPVSGTCYTVDTGVNKYWVRTDSFNLFDQVKNSAGTVTYVPHSTSGGIVAVTSAGTFTSATVPTATPGIPGYAISLEIPNSGGAGTPCAGLGYPCANEGGENLYAQIKVSGALWNGTSPKFTYVGRLFFFGGDGMWLWKGTMIYSEDMFATANKPTEVGLHLPTALSTTNTATFGTTYGTPSANVAVALTNQTAYLSQYDHGNTVQNTLGNPYAGTATTSAPYYVCDDVAAQNAATGSGTFGGITGQANCPSLSLTGFRVVKTTTTQTSGTQADGWLGLDDTTIQANVWMRDFWQNYPAELHVTGATIGVDIWPKDGDTLVDGRSTGDLTASVGYKRDMALAGQTGFGHYWPWQTGAAMDLQIMSPNPNRAVFNGFTPVTTAGTPVVLVGYATNYQMNDTPCNGAGCKFWPPCTLVSGVCQFDSTKAHKVYFKGFTSGWAPMNGYKLAMFTGSTAASGSNNYPQLAIFNTDGTIVDGSGFGAVPTGCLGGSPAGACLISTIDVMTDSNMDSFGRAFEVAGNFTSHAGAAPGNDAARWRDTLLFTNTTYYTDTTLVFGHAHKQDTASFLRSENLITSAFNNLYKRAVIQNMYGIYYGFELYQGPPAGFGQRYLAALGRRRYDIGYWLQWARTADPKYFHLGQAFLQAAERELQHPPQVTVSSAYAGVGLDHTGSASGNVFWDTKHYKDTLGNEVVKHDGAHRCTEGWGASVWFSVYTQAFNFTGEGSPAADVNSCSDGQSPWLDYVTTSERFDYDIAGNPRNKDLVTSIANNVIFASSGSGTLRTIPAAPTAVVDETSGIYNGGAFGRAFGGCIQVGTDAAELLGNATTNYITLADACFRANIQDKSLITVWTQNPTGILYDDSSIGTKSATPSATAHTHYGSHYFASAWSYWSLPEYVDYKGNVTVSAPATYGTASAVNVRTALNNFANGVLGYFNTTTKSGGFYTWQFPARAAADSQALTSDAEQLKYIKRAFDFHTWGADDAVQSTGCVEQGSASLVGDTPSTAPTGICASPTPLNGTTCSGGITLACPAVALTNAVNPNAYTQSAPDVHDEGLLVTGLPYLEYSLSGQSPAKPNTPPSFVLVPVVGATNSPLTWIYNNASGAQVTFDLAVRIAVSSDFGNLSIVTPISGDFSLTVVNPSGTNVSGITVADSAGDTYTGNPTAVFKTPTQMWPPAAGGGAGACLSAPAPPSINYDGASNTHDNRDFLVTVPAGATGEYRIQMTYAGCTDPNGTSIGVASILSHSSGNVDLLVCPTLATGGTCTAANQFSKVETGSIQYANISGSVTKFQGDSSFRFATITPSDILYRGGTVKTIVPATGGWALAQNGGWISESSFTISIGGVGGVKPLVSPSPAYFYDSGNYSNQSFISNANNPFTINISGCAITTASPLASGTTNTSYSPTVQETTSGCGAGTPAWTVVSGSLPPGMSLSSAGVVSGTPTLHGTYNFTVHVSGLASTPSDAPQQIVINDPATCSINSGQNPLPSGNQNVLYSYTILTSNCASPETWSITVGSLPTGLTIDNTGKISGTPTGSGTSSFTAHIVDNNNTAVDLATSINIVASAPCVIANSSPLANGAQTVAYGPVTLTANNCGTVIGSGWVVTVGSLPTGLTLHSTTGVIDGTPSGTGTSTFTVQFNETGGTNPTKQFQISVTAAPNINPSTVPNGSVNNSYSVQLSAVGGTAPYTWSVISGALPTGLALGASTGLISGTPTVAGTYTFQVQVQDSLSATGNVTYSNVIIFSAGGSHHSGTHNIQAR